jgi:23S rRNA (cytosine1962-C5)-methyltransferase
MKPLILKKNEDKRLLQGHLWVYSNEVDTKRSPLTEFSPGEKVTLEDHRGRRLGTAYVNPHSLLCARLLSSDPELKVNESFFVERIENALKMREEIFSEPFYRLIYGESDYLPGLIVDSYDQLLVAQITTAGMEACSDILVNALCQVLAPEAILWRNEGHMRDLEGMPKYVSAARGQPAHKCLVKENSVKFWMNPWEGQKTGWFYDHRENRRQLQRFVEGKKVLDVFSYVGAWSVQAAVFGAKEVWSVDSSSLALDQCKENAEINGVAHKVKTFQNDAFDQLKQFAGDKIKFDIIILDPPAFIKKRKDHASGFLAYQRLNALALRLLNSHGILISASCSHHLSEAELQRAILLASVHEKTPLQILAKGHQGWDHPVHPAIPETSYLKTLFCRKIMVV